LNKREKYIDQFNSNALAKIHRSNSVPVQANYNEVKLIKKKSISSTNLINEINKDSDQRDSERFGSKNLENITNKKENKKGTLKQKSNMFKFLFKIRK
jgi:hypothetical protein